MGLGSLQSLLHQRRAQRPLFLERVHSPRRTSSGLGLGSHLFGNVRLSVSNLLFRPRQ